MSARLDALQLEQLWDASVLGGPLPVAGGDADDLVLLDLLSSLSHPAPNSAFVRTLERKLALAPGTDSISTTAGTPSASKPNLDKTSRAWWRRPPSRWMTAGYALAAIALVVFLSTFAIARQRIGDDNGPSIPAVSDWTNGGPPTSPGVVTTTHFAQTWAPDELAGFSFDQWGWIELQRGVASPGERSHGLDNSPGPDSQSHPGMSVIVVVQGQFLVDLRASAFVWHPDGRGLEQLPGPTQVTLESGDALIFGLGALDELWNPLDTETSYVTGGLYSLPDYPINFSEPASSDVHSGISFERNLLAGVRSLDLSLEQVSIPPGATYSYSITPQTLLLADVTGDGLVKQAWANGIRRGDRQPILASSYALHQDGPGYYTLTNTGDELVEITLFSVAPPAPATSSNVLPASVETLFSRTFSTGELASYSLDEWGWIELVHGVVTPHTRSTWDVNPDLPNVMIYPGMSVVSIESGQLAVSVKAGASVVRGIPGIMELIDAPQTVTLGPGDALIYPVNTLTGIWNPTDETTVYAAGGMYSKPDYPVNFSLADELAWDVHFGTAIDASKLPSNSALSMEMDHVSIAPGQTYAYSIGPESWLLASVMNGTLEQQQWDDGRATGSGRTLQESTYVLHNDGPGDYTLTNTSDTAVDVYLFGVKPVPEAAAAQAPGATSGIR